MAPVEPLNQDASFERAQLEPNVGNGHPADSLRHVDRAPRLAWDW